MSKKEIGSPDNTAMFGGGQVTASYNEVVKDYNVAFSFETTEGDTVFLSIAPEHALKLAEALKDEANNCIKEGVKN